MKLANRVHVKTLRDQPHGRGVQDVVLNDIPLTDISRVTVEYSPDALNMVTLTFPAHVTIEEVGE